MSTKRVKARDEGIDFSRLYNPVEAISLVRERATARFDETIEVVFDCNVDPRKGDQNIRGVVDLPEGTGKVVKVAVFAEGDDVALAKDAGADAVGSDDLMDRIKDGPFDFDVCIATFSIMPKLAKYGRFLGPKGLMPNPKLGTVTDDVVAAVQASKAGRVSIRCDKEGVVHSIIGKASFSVESLNHNFETLYQELLKMRPSGVKGNLIKRVFVSSTMGFALSLLPISERGIVFPKG